LPQHVGEQAEHAGNTKSDAEESRFASGGPLCEGDRCRCLPDEMSAAVGEEPPGIREAHVAIAADQEWTTDSFLHATKPLAQRRLRDVQTISGAAEMQRLGQGEQRAQVVKIDIHNLRLSDSARRFIGRNRAR
jgi:hypothetical protein